MEDSDDEDKKFGNKILLFDTATNTLKYMNDLSSILYDRLDVATHNIFSLFTKQQTKKFITDLILVLYSDAKLSNSFDDYYPYNIEILTIILNCFQLSPGLIQLFDDNITHLYLEDKISEQNFYLLYNEIKESIILTLISITPVIFISINRSNVSISRSLYLFTESTIYNIYDLISVYHYLTKYKTPIQIGFNKEYKSFLSYFAFDNGSKISDPDRRTWYLLYMEYISKLQKQESSLLFIEDFSTTRKLVKTLIEK